MVYGKLLGKEFGRFGTEKEKYFRCWAIFQIRNARCVLGGGGGGGRGSHRFGLCCNMSAGRLWMDQFVFLTSIKVQYIPQMSLSSDILFSLR